MATTPTAIVPASCTDVKRFPCVFHPIKRKMAYGRCQLAACVLRLTGYRRFIPDSDLFFFIIFIYFILFILHSERIQKNALIDNRIGGLISWLSTEFFVF